VCPGDVSLSQSVVSGTALSVQPAGTVRLLQLLALDAFGNAVTAATTASNVPIVFTVNVTGPQSLNAALVAAGGGVYQATVNLTVAGTYSLAVNYNAQPIAASPYTVTTLPGDTQAQKLHLTRSAH
jgi:hypothetical protein